VLNEGYEIGFIEGQCHASTSKQAIHEMATIVGGISCEETASKAY
jgi:hypothetical protein